MSIDILRLLEDYGKLIEPFLKKEFPTGQYPFLSDGAIYHFDSGGKRLRPSLCLLTCQGLNGKIEAALPFACASEILHNLFLLHDDIEDGDTKRRNRNTLWVEFGLPNAINIGDFLAAKAYLILLKSPIPVESIQQMIHVFSETYLITTRGQALDINLRASKNLTKQQYIDIVSLKTAKYLGYNLVGGAIAAGADKALIDSLWKVGQSLGPAFQIQDDLLDLTNGKGRGGKIGCDIREGKPTIFLAHVLEKNSKEADIKKLLNILRKKRSETTEEDISWAIDFYKQNGALDFARNKAKELATEANLLINELPLSNKDIFSEICNFVVERPV